MDQFNLLIISEDSIIPFEKIDHLGLVLCGFNHLTSVLWASSFDFWQGFDQTKSQKGLCYYIW
jgi:hypothetical protein